MGCVLALTATATPGVARDIAQAFRIEAGNIVVTGFHRPNLELHAIPCRAGDRFPLLRKHLESRPPGPAIVYVTLQKTAEQVAKALAGLGYDAVAYHAGLGDEQRHRIQDAFMGAESQIIVATIAFGMGIDKADIRTVYHYNLPKSPEGYAQEIGRAGRDGAPAGCVLFACAEDVVALENFAYGDTPTPEAVAGFLAEVLGRGSEFDVSVYHLSKTYDIRLSVVQTLLTYLELEELLVATGSFCNEYKFQLQRPIEAITGRIDARRAAFLRRLLGLARRGHTWWSLEMALTVRALQEPRQRIVEALAALEDQGELVLQRSGMRQGYRLLQAEPDLRRLGSLLAERLQQREAREVARVRNMLEYAAGGGLPDASVAGPLRRGHG